MRCSCPSSTTRKSSAVSPGDDLALVVEHRDPEPDEVDAAPEHRLRGGRNCPREDQDDRRRDSAHGTLLIRMTAILSDSRSADRRGSTAAPPCPRL